MKTKGEIKNEELDKHLVQFKNHIGGRVKWINTGSAPINPDIIDFCKVVFSCHFIEAYGMTETTACCTS